MVRAKKAALIAGISALVVGAIHYGAHKVFSALPIQQQVMAVGASIVVATFVIGFVGMIR